MVKSVIRKQLIIAHLFKEPIVARFMLPGYPDKLILQNGYATSPNLFNMKKYLLFLLLSPLVSNKAFSQTLRKCGCQTWRQWKSEAKIAEDTRSEKRQKYAKYKDKCLAVCRAVRNKDRKGDVN